MRVINALFWFAHLRFELIGLDAINDVLVDGSTISGTDRPTVVQEAPKGNLGMTYKALGRFALEMPMNLQTLSKLKIILDVTAQSR